ncbi:MAG: TetR/AcrR family transcriptional regulator [Bacteroidaceae bacterium]|nr:TetR/AcrR family transcriptional regulator [Bacteroidaceae bacterium]
MIIATTDREDIRNKAVQAATEVFLRDGVEAVRMDDLAQSLSVSKRTLYEIFGSKEDLLVECLQRHITRITGLIEEEMGTEEDVLTVFLRHLEVLINESRGTNHYKFTDMDKYPKLKSIFIEHLADMEGRMRTFMDLGVKQGVFRDDLNMDVLMKAFGVMGRMTKEESQRGEFRYDELIDGTMVVLLRGIAAPKGMEKLEKYRYKSKY